MNGDYMVEATHNAKVQMYDIRCMKAGLIFCPPVVDTFGGRYPEAMAIVVRLGQQLTRNMDWEVRETVQRLCQRLAITLVRDCTYVLNKRGPPSPSPSWTTTGTGRSLGGCRPSQCPPPL